MFRKYFGDHEKRKRFNNEEQLTFKKTHKKPRITLKDSFPIVSIKSKDEIKFKKNS